MKSLILLLKACILLISLQSYHIQANIQFEPSCVSPGSTPYCSSDYIVVGATTPTGFRLLARSSNNFDPVYFGQLYDSQQKNIYALNNTDQQIQQKMGQQVIDYSNYPNFGSIVLGDGSSNQVYYIWGFGPPYPSTLQAFVCTQNNKQDANGDYTFRIQRLVELTVATNLSGIWDITGGTTYNNRVTLMTEGHPPNVQALSSSSCLIDQYKQGCLNSTDKTSFTNLIDFLRFSGNYPTNYKGVLSQYSLSSLPAPFNPYMYGFPVGVSFGVGPQGPTVSGIRYYNMGRMDHRGAVIMGDGLTVYFPVGSGGLFKFVLITPGDFTAGRLFIAQMTQADTQTGVLPQGVASYQLNVKWIPMYNDTITLQQANATFTNPLFPNNQQVLFNAQGPDTTGNCPDTGAISVKVGGNTSCIKIPTDPAAYLTLVLAEPIFMGKYLGGTVDSLYFGAMTNTSNSTFLTVQRIVNEGTLKLPNNKCGCIFQGDIDASNSIYLMRPYICGVSSGDGCSNDYPANPVSAASIPKYNRVFIGEDSTFHDNNYLWFLNPETRNVTRILATPTRGGINYLGYQTGIYQVNYLSMSIAHPYKDLTNLNTNQSTGPNGWTGYLTINEANNQMSYEPVSVPYTAGQKSLVTDSRAITYGTGYNLTSTTFLQGGKIYGNEGSTITMALYDKAGNVIKNGQGKAVQGKFIQATYVPCGSKVAGVVTYSGLPSTQFEVDLGVSDNGNLGVLGTGNVTRPITEWNDDQWGGLWNTKTGRVSTYQSLILGEIWEPDASVYQRSKCGSGGRCLQTDVTTYAKYFGVNTIEGNAAGFNIYQYGWTLETNVTSSNNSCAVSNVKKIYPMGRFSHGDYLFMKDNKTVYMPDYNVTGGFFQFVADQPNNYESGTLSAAKFTPKGNLDQYSISFIPLGKANQAQLAAAVLKKPNFTDIFDYAAPQKDGSCPSGFTLVPLDENVPECLSSKNDLLAAFLETRRFAVIKNATINLSFMSSIAIDAARNTIAVSFESVQGRMAERVNSNDPKAAQPKYPVDVQFNQFACGMIAFITYDPTSLALLQMTASIYGSSDPNDGADTTNTCSLNTIARPTHLYVAADQMLMVGEQSDTVENYESNPGAKSYLTSTYSHQYPRLWQIDLDNFNISRSNGYTTVAYGYKGGSIQNFQYVQFSQNRHLMVSIGQPNNAALPSQQLYMGKYSFVVPKAQEQLSISNNGGVAAPTDNTVQTQLQNQQNVFRGPSQGQNGGQAKAPGSSGTSSVQFQLSALVVLFVLSMLV